MKGEAFSWAGLMELIENYYPKTSFTAVDRPIRFLEGLEFLPSSVRVSPLLAKLYRINSPAWIRWL